MSQPKNFCTDLQAKRIKSLPNSINFLPKEFSFLEKKAALKYLTEAPSIVATNKTENELIIKCSQCLVKSTSMQSLKSFNLHQRIMFKNDFTNASAPEEILLNSQLSVSLENKFYFHSNLQAIADSCSDVYMRNSKDDIELSQILASRDQCNMSECMSNEFKIIDNEDSAYSSLETENLIKDSDDDESDPKKINTLDIVLKNNTLLGDDDEDDDIIFNINDDIEMCCWSPNNDFKNSKNTMNEENVNNEDYIENELDSTEDDEDKYDNDDADDADDDEWFLNDSRYISPGEITKDSSSDSSPVLFSMDSCPYFSPTWNSGIMEEFNKIWRFPCDVKDRARDGPLSEVNKRWCQFYKGGSSPKKLSSCSRMVRFSSSHHLVTCYEIDSEECRAGPWEEIGRDRVRFQNRIEEMSTIIAPILTTPHRCKILQLLNKFLENI